MENWAAGERMESLNGRRYSVKHPVLRGSYFARQLFATLMPYCAFLAHIHICFNVTGVELGGVLEMLKKETKHMSRMVYESFNEYYCFTDVLVF